jgi:peptidoglycan/xylan/chitin deacetylase (PgdA/CDA1 family)
MVSWPNLQEVKFKYGHLPEAALTNGGHHEAPVRPVLLNTKGMKKLIILMHDGKSYTAQALPKIIEGLQKQGYIFDVLKNY